MQNKLTRLTKQEPETFRPNEPLKQKKTEKIQTGIIFKTTGVNQRHLKLQLKLVPAQNKS